MPAGTKWKLSLFRCSKNLMFLFFSIMKRDCSFIQNPKSSLRFFLQTVLAEYYCVCQKLDVFCWPRLPVVCIQNDDAEWLFMNNCHLTNSVWFRVTSDKTPLLKDRQHEYTIPPPAPLIPPHTGHNTHNGLTKAELRSMTQVITVVSNKRDTIRSCDVSYYSGGCEMHFCWETNTESERVMTAALILNCPMIIFTDSFSRYHLFNNNTPSAEFCRHNFFQFEHSTSSFLPPPRRSLTALFVWRRRISCPQPRARRRRDRQRLWRGRSLGRDNQQLSVSGAAAWSASLRCSPGETRAERSCGECSPTSGACWGWSWSP